MSLLETISFTLNKGTPKVSIEAVASKLNQTSTPSFFDKYFEPDKGGRVRLRDVFNPTNIGEAAGKVGAKVFDFGREVFQGTARSGASVGMSLQNRVNKVIGQPTVDRIEPPKQIDDFESAFFSVLFGDDAIESLEERVKKAPERADKFSEELGLDGQSIINRATAPFAVIGMTAADFIGGGGKGPVVKALAKSRTAEEIVNILKGGVRGIAETDLPIVAKELETITDPKQVEKVLDTYITKTKNLPVEKERGFITTAKESDLVSPEVKARLASNYNVLNNTDTLNEARRLMTSDVNEANRLANASGKLTVSELRVANAVSQLKIVEAQNAGNFDEVKRLIDIIAERSTSAGQGVQVLSAFNRLSPAGIIRYTEKVLKDASAGLPEVKKLKLSPEKAKEIADMAKRVSTMPDGEKKAVETALMVKKINELVPAGTLKKISTVQTMAQLLNPKTFIRNIGGNFGFSAAENVKDVFAAGLDSAVSLITGKHATALPSIQEQVLGGVKGVRKGIRDALLGIDTASAPTRFDLPSSPVFTGSVGEKAEKLLNLSLRAPDRAMYQAAYDGEIYKQMVAYEKSTGEILAEPSAEMAEAAHLEGLYRTFQDVNALSKMFVGLKRVANLGKDFGLGDIILKYPKTPANLLARGIDYSPAGFVKTVYHLAKPLTGKGFDQRAFVEATARAFTGSAGLVGTGALLHRLGIITGAREKDAEINQTQRISGLGQYRFNISGLKRFAMSGFDADEAKLQKGDKLINYDWFQPLAIPVSVGANIDESSQLRENTKDTALGIAEAIIEGVGSGLDTLAEQPLVQNLQRIMKYGNASDAAMELAQQIPASFVPTLLNQVNQFIDNTSRSTYDPSILHEAFNMAKRKVPGLSQTLQPNVDVFGRPMETYQGGSNNLFNVFFNPAFLTYYNPTPEAELVLDLFKDTGETKQAGRIAAKKVTVNGEQMELGPKQVTAMQQFIGTVTRWYFDSLSKSPDFKDLPNEEKVKHMSNVLSDIGSAGKFVVLGDRPKERNLNYRTQGIIANYLKTRFLDTDPLF